MAVECEWCSLDGAEASSVEGDIIDLCDVCLAEIQTGKYCGHCVRIHVLYTRTTRTTQAIVPELSVHDVLAEVEAILRPPAR